MPEWTRCVNDSRLQDESGVHSQASVTSITRTPWIVDTLSSFAAFGRQCDSGKHLWEKREKMNSIEYGENGNLDILVGWNKILLKKKRWGGREHGMAGHASHSETLYRYRYAEWARASTRLHRIRTLFRRTFRRESISIVSTEEFIILSYPCASLSRSDVSFGTRFLSWRAGHLIILAAG